MGMRGWFVIAIPALYIRFTMGASLGPQGGGAVGPQTSPCRRPQRRAPQRDRAGAWAVDVRGHETCVDGDGGLLYYYLLISYRL